LLKVSPGGIGSGGLHRGGVVANLVYHYQHSRTPTTEPDMRPEAYELDPSNYPFTLDIATRYSDMDAHQHVNNVAIARLFEESRLRFALFSRAKPVHELREQARVVAVSLLINYLGEVSYPEPVTVAVGVNRIGTSSFTLSCLMLQLGKPVAHSRATLVRSEGSGGLPLPMEMVEALTRCLIRQG